MKTECEQCGEMVQDMHAHQGQHMAENLTETVNNITRQANLYQNALRITEISANNALPVADVMELYRQAMVAIMESGMY